MKDVKKKFSSLKHKDFSEILDVLFSVNCSKKNCAFLTDYFLHEFSAHPKDFLEILHTLKSNLSNKQSEKREKFAQIYLEVFSFLCERFWFYEDKLDLDDLCFSILAHDDYLHLKKKLEKYQKKSKNIIDEIYKTFQNTLQTHNISCQLKWRYKNIYSIYKKLTKKNVADVLKLSDIFAFRIVIDGNAEKCFDVLNILHDSFIPIPKRYKDYVTIPKINGYQSIHTCLLWVHSDLDLATEVQIRTTTMDKIAESGIAAHFLYATEKKSKMVWEKEQKLIENMEKMTESISKNLDVYCLTPKWDIIRVQKWSTIRDFAEKIHTKLAIKARFWMVNEIQQPLNYIIKNFDSIKIIT